MTKVDLSEITSPVQVDALDAKDCGEEDADTYNLTTAHLSEQYSRDKHRRTDEFIKDTQQDRNQRKDYATKIFWLVCAWLAAILGLVFCTGLKRLDLSDSVLITLISSVSVNIIGLMAIVANYLFPKTGRKHRDYHDESSD